MRKEFFSVPQPMVNMGSKTKKEISVTRTYICYTSFTCSLFKNVAPQHDQQQGKCPSFKFSLFSFKEYKSKRKVTFVLDFFFHSKYLNSLITF